MRVLALLIVLVTGAAHAAGDAARGARVFAQRIACHSATPGEHLTGPSLAHIWNRRAATAEGFQRYSEALKKSALVWNEATLNKWLASPQKLVAGTSMTFPGIKEHQVREDLIAYLKAVDENKVPADVKAGGMRGMARQKADLKGAPATGQVRSDPALRRYLHSGDGGWQNREGLGIQPAVQDRFEQARSNSWTARDRRRRHAGRSRFNRVLVAEGN
jgi:cytochrome c